MSAAGEDPGWLDVTGVVTGTGFNKSALSVPLLRRLIEFYRVPIEGGRMKLQSNCGLPGLDRPNRRFDAFDRHSRAQARAEDTPEGVLLTITTPSEDHVAELQQKSNNMLQRQQEKGTSARHGMDQAPGIEYQVMGGGRVAGSAGSPSAGSGRILPTGARSNSSGCTA